MMRLQNVHLFLNQGMATNMDSKGLLESKWRCCYHETVVDSRMYYLSSYYHETVVDSRGVLKNHRSFCYHEIVGDSRDILEPSWSS
jgi:hypothetical protein